MLRMTFPILWQSQDQTITLIDIPRSIAAAQCSESASHSHLLSSPPLQSPFPSNEPKTQSAKPGVGIDSTYEHVHAEYQHLLQRALHETESHHAGEWCLPRPFVEHTVPAKKKRRIDESNEATPHEGEVSLPGQLLSDVARLGSHNAQICSLQLQSKASTDRKSEDQIDCAPNKEGLVVSNTSTQTGILQISAKDTGKDFSFHVPPGASFYLGDCRNSRDFRKAVRKQAESSGTRSSFDIVLLDPPWPNRSVKRTHKTAGSTYATTSSLDDIRDLLLDTHLETLLEDNCLVGIWITNKTSIRDLVLGENGIFECWNVELMEEWIWLKTTVNGEPVTPLEGVWRKPYEVLLLGRRTAKAQKAIEEPPLPSAVKRRVILGVPDLHSRKPCLKSLIEPMMDDSTQYRALEVFARHLVAGWWSWGDECIKFNWDGYWTKNANE